MLDTDLFAPNARPLAAYLEPEGYADLCQMQRPNVRSYERLVPRTVEIAQRVWDLMPQRDVWGHQRADRQWVTETDGNWSQREVRGKNLKLLQYGLQVQDLIKHFAGRTHAVGTSDVHRVNEVWDPRTHEFCEVPTRVRCLRLDVDQDEAWARRDADSIFDELHEQRLVAQGLGLPYHAFRTGGRGFQAVLALPARVPHPLASFLLESYRWLLELRGTERAHLDADNLHKLMRLPGGTHASNYHLGLWIDLEQQQLCPLEEQVRLMTAAFRYPRDLQRGYWTPAAFAEAANDLLQRMRALRVSSGTLLTREQTVALIEDCPENPIIQRWYQARALTETLRIPCQVVPRNVPQGSASQGTDARIVGTDPTDGISGSHAIATSQRRYSKEWAAQVWLDRFAPGGFWDWLNTGGSNGILASVILFGEEGAVPALRRLAEEVPVRRPADLQDRYRTIAGCWKSFRLKGFVAVERCGSAPQVLSLGEASAELHELAESIVRQMRARDPKGKWKSELAHRLVLVLLLALQDSPNGRVEVSYRSLAETINQRWPDQPPTNRTRVQEMLARLSPGDQCLYEMLRRAKGLAAIGQPDRYAPGTDLARTPLGKVWMMRKLLEGRELADFLWDAEDEDGRGVPVELGETGGEG